jgi:hypothetical protein
MTPQDFCYWLQGFAELTDKPPTAAQWKAIQDHLALAFTKVTPTYDWLKLGQTPNLPHTSPFQVTC